MGNVTLPTPVFAAGGAACLLAGFFVGSVLAPSSPDTATAKVVEYSAAKNNLCLSGDAVKDLPGVGSDGELCGTWRRTVGSSVPQPGDEFRFVAVHTTDDSSGGDHAATVFYGDVVR